MALARSKFPNGELLNFKLETVAEFLKIDTNLSLHTSMDDTIICSNVFKYFYELFKRRSFSGKSIFSTRV